MTTWSPVNRKSRAPLARPRSSAFSSSSCWMDGFPLRPPGSGDGFRSSRARRGSRPRRAGPFQPGGGLSPASRRSTRSLQGGGIAVNRLVLFSAARQTMEGASASNWIALADPLGTVHAWWGDAPASLAGLIKRGRDRGALVRDGADSRLPPLDRRRPFRRNRLLGALLPRRGARLRQGARSVRRGSVLGARGAGRERRAAPRRLGPCRRRGQARRGRPRVGQPWQRSPLRRASCSSRCCWSDAPATRSRIGVALWRSRSSRSRRAKVLTSSPPAASCSSPLGLLLLPYLLGAPAGRTAPSRPGRFRFGWGYGLALLAVRGGREHLAVPELGSPPRFSSLARLAALSALLIDALALASSGRRGGSGQRMTRGAALHGARDRRTASPSSVLRVFSPAFSRPLRRARSSSGRARSRPPGQTRDLAVPRLLTGAALLRHAPRRAALGASARGPVSRGFARDRPARIPAARPPDAVFAAERAAERVARFDLGAGPARRARSVRPLRPGLPDLEGWRETVPVLRRSWPTRSSTPRARSEAASRSSRTGARSSRARGTCPSTGTTWRSCGATVPLARGVAAVGARRDHRRGLAVAGIRSRRGSTSTAGSCSGRAGGPPAASPPRPVLASYARDGEKRDEGPTLSTALRERLRRSAGPVPVRLSFRGEELWGEIRPGARGLPARRGSGP